MPSEYLYISKNITCFKEVRFYGQLQHCKTILANMYLFSSNLTCTEANHLHVERKNNQRTINLRTSKK